MNALDGHYILKPQIALQAFTAKEQLKRVRDYF